MRYSMNSNQKLWKKKIICAPTFCIATVKHNIRRQISCISNIFFHSLNLLLIFLFFLFSTIRLTMLLFTSYKLSSNYCTDPVSLCIPFFYLNLSVFLFHILTTILFIQSFILCRFSLPLLLFLLPTIWKVIIVNRNYSGI